MVFVRWRFVVLGGLMALAAPRAARAQSVTVHGAVRARSDGPQAYGQPPPGYGQAHYGPPRPGQPRDAQPYAPRTRQLRYVHRETAVKGLWIPGIILFGASWVLTGTVASSLDAGDYGEFAWLPLIGPWLMVSAAGSDEEVGAALISGVAQLAGATMFVLGLLLHQRVRVAVYSFDGRDERAARLALDLLPAPMGARVGLTFSHF